MGQASGPTIAAGVEPVSSSPGLTSASSNPVPSRASITALSWEHPAELSRRAIELGVLLRSLA